MLAETLILHVLLGVAAWIYVIKLTEPGMIFGWLSSLLTRYLPEWLHKPLISCEYCVAGQLGFWACLFRFSHYDLWWHIAFTGLSIMTVELTNILYERAKKN